APGQHDRDQRDKSDGKRGELAHDERSPPRYSGRALCALGPIVRSATRPVRIRMDYPDRPVGGSCYRDVTGPAWKREILLIRRSSTSALAVLACLLVIWAPARAASPAPAGSAANRPFPAPITSRILDVPATVTTGSRFNDWLADVPDGSIVEFPKNASIDLDTGFAIERRDNLMLRLNGATLRVHGPGDVPESSPFFVRESSHIAIEGPATVLGNNPNTTTVFTPGSENSHVLALSGWGGQGPSSYIELSGIDAQNVYGD